MEVVKFQQAQLINFDLDMYYAKTDTPALCRTSSLVEELGQIEFIFSDKTGTLTCNEMEFRCCSIAGVGYADVVDESKRGEDGKDGWRSFAEMKTLLAGGANPFVDVAPTPGSEREVVDEFLTLLAVCHTVIPENRDGKMHYQASSPDEAALVAGAELLDYKFHVRSVITIRDDDSDMSQTRKPKSVFVNIRGTDLEYEILNVCEFNSTRKRMSTIVRCPDGKIKVFCKGADTVILERLSENQPYVEKTLLHLEVSAYATLLNASETDWSFRIMLRKVFALSASLVARSLSRNTGNGLRFTMKLLLLLTGVARLWTRLLSSSRGTCFCLGPLLSRTSCRTESRIPSTLYRWLASRYTTSCCRGIYSLISVCQVWVLTGDRQETAINIGMSCRLISESMNLVSCTHAFTRS